MKKKIVSCILCAAATISLVSGCGSNKETETDKKEAHAEKSVQSEDRNYEPVTIHAESGSDPGWEKCRVYL